MSNVTEKDLDIVKRNFKWVADQLDYLMPQSSNLVVILMGSSSDEEHCKKIVKHVKDLGLKGQLRVCSAHKGTQETLRILAEYEGSREKVCIFMYFLTASSVIIRKKNMSLYLPALDRQLRSDLYNDLYVAGTYVVKQL